METAPVPVPSGAEQPPAPLFEVRQVMTEELYAEFYRAHRKKSGTQWILLGIGLSFVVCGAVSLNVMYLIVHRFFFLGAAAFAFGLLFLLLSPLSFLIGRNQTVQMNSGTLNMPSTLYFYDWGYDNVTPRGYVQCPYTALSQVVETHRLLLLYQNKFQAAVIDKACFTKGTPEELVRFLCGGGRLPYKRMK